MDIERFQKILQCFSDEPDDIEFSRGHFIVQVRDEMISADLIEDKGQLFVVEEDDKISAYSWFIKKIARMNQLADRFINYLPTEKNFVRPEGKFLDQIDISPTEKEQDVDDALNKVVEVFSKKEAGASNILYLTAHAGEGKTTLINQIAYQQAKRYKKGKADWLLLPVILGGRPFLRFDDVVIGSLVNRFRFPFYYYEAFIELVKLGVIVPAFDGFEEMFIESSTGEALSSLGNLIQSLESRGSVLISARKAYFEYKDFRSQAKLFDSIDKDYVSFSKLSIKRWSKKQFVTYCQNREINNPDDLYNDISNRLSANHPLLTRAVLVKRLIDIAISINREDLLDKLGESTEDYFYNFVGTIIEREASEKWIDRSGEPMKPLLDVKDHHILLSFLANEMWISNTDFLRPEMLELISDLFSEQYKISPDINRQIKERIKQHSLITNASQNPNYFQFDHEEFKNFFLGLYISLKIIEEGEVELLTILRKGALSDQAIRSIWIHLKREKVNRKKAIELLKNVSNKDSKTSFTSENCGIIILFILNNFNVENMPIKDFIFPRDSLKNKTLKNISFANCHFQPSSLFHTKLVACTFENCKFDRLDLFDDLTVSDVIFSKSEIQSIRLKDESRIFNPDSIPRYLNMHGFKFQLSSDSEYDIFEREEIDQKLQIVERAFRVFLRATFVNENVFKIRLGTQSNLFFDEIIGELLSRNILEEKPHTGSGSQRRFKLNSKLENVENAFQKSKGSFDVFLSMFDNEMK